MRFRRGPCATTAGGWGDNTTRLVALKMSEKLGQAVVIEQNLWQVFCDTIELPTAWRDDRLDPIGTRLAIADIIGRHSSAHWRHKFEGTDACAVVVNTLQEGAAHPHFRARGLLSRQIFDGTRSAPAWKVPLDAQFVREELDASWPALGEADDLFDH